MSGTLAGPPKCAVSPNPVFRGPFKPLQILPEPVAKGLTPEVEAIMGSSRINLLTASGFLALFFATSAIETMRAALNGAYRVYETRPYALCLLISMLFVFVSAVSTLFLTWAS